MSEAPHHQCPTALGTGAWCPILLRERVTLFFCECGPVLSRGAVGAAHVSLPAARRAGVAPELV
jgi:hypothetical protein